MTDQPVFAHGDFRRPPVAAGDQVRAYVNKVADIERQRAYLRGCVRDVLRDAAQNGFNAQMIRHAARIMTSRHGPQGYEIQQRTLKTYVAAAVGEQLDLLTPVTPPPPAGAEKDDATRG